MWSSYGIYCGNLATPSFSCPHPIIADKSLYFMADVPHLIKNLKGALVNHSTISYGDKTISIRPIKHLAKYQDSRELKLAPKLTLASVTASQFEKMKVSNATRVLSNSVSSALVWMVENNVMETSLVKEALDTAWFIKKVNHWFDRMFSRHAGLALSYTNIQKYDLAIQDLTEFVSIAREMKIGVQNRWKPVQTGIILSTSTVISLADTLLTSRNGFQFLLTSRLTQDCLENLFSSIRLRNPTPTPVELKNALKIITVAQFLKKARFSSYDDDDASYLINYLEPLQYDADDEVPYPTEVVVVDNMCSVSLDPSDVAALYYLTGTLYMYDNTSIIQYSTLIFERILSLSYSCTVPVFA